MILFLLIPLAIIIWIVVSSRQRNAAQEEAQQAARQKSAALALQHGIEKREAEERARWRRQREKDASVIFVDTANEIQSAESLPAPDTLQAYVSASKKSEAFED